MINHIKLQNDWGDICCCFHFELLATLCLHLFHSIVNLGDITEGRIAYPPRQWINSLREQGACLGAATENCSILKHWFLSSKEAVYVISQCSPFLVVTGLGHNCIIMGNFCPCHPYFFPFTWELWTTKVLQEFDSTVNFLQMIYIIYWRSSKFRTIWE